jgi:hypothetical protein
MLGVIDCWIEAEVDWSAIPLCGVYGRTERLSISRFFGLAMRQTPSSPVPLSRARERGGAQRRGEGVPARQNAEHAMG